MTIHAGEQIDCEDNIRIALKYGAKRIGHGLHINDPLLLQEIIKKDILIECCITSNFGWASIGITY